MLLQHPRLVRDPHSALAAAILYPGAASLWISGFQIRITLHAAKVV
jgi:hypothetical protein